MLIFLNHLINGISLGTLLIQAFYSDSEQILYGVISTLFPRK